MAFCISRMLFLFSLIWLSVLICLSSGFAAANASSVSLSKAELQDLEVFQQWKMKHGKDYANTEESKIRHGIFQRNLKYITETNAKRSNKSSSGGGYRLGLTKFADMSPEEFRQLYLGQLEVPTTAAPPATSRPGYMQQKESCEAPPSMDWRQRRVVTPVKHQQRCGSCWAFAATGAIESASAISTGNLISLSEQELVDCVSMNSGCGGGWPKNAFDWVITNGGIGKEEDYPYVAQQGYCKASMINGAVNINSYESVEKSDSALLCATAKQPITVALDGTDLQFYQGGIYDGENCPMESSPTHVVLIVGYDTKEGTDYWIAKNSWGEDWGMNGYLFIQRNTNLPNGVCSMNSYASYPTI